MNTEFYSSDFYSRQMGRSEQSATKVLPALFASRRITSVVDFGCGVGTWLNVVRRLGVSDVVGLDGDYVDNSLLQIPKDLFVPMDLSKKVQLGRKFDLALSLEVAEHIDSTSAEQFVLNLCEHADIILFSAAVPGQGGVNHVNEQWQSYWLKLFEMQGFIVDYSLRNELWNDEEIAFYYRQNMLLVSRAGMYRVDCDGLVDVVHPAMFSNLLASYDAVSLRTLIISLQRYVRSKLKRLKKC